MRFAKRIIQFKGSSRRSSRFRVTLMRRFVTPTTQNRVRISQSGPRARVSGLDLNRRFEMLDGLAQPQFQSACPIGSGLGDKDDKLPRFGCSASGPGPVLQRSDASAVVCDFFGNQLLRTTDLRVV